MSPNGQDIDIQFDPRSIIEGFRRIDKARQDMDKGVVGAAEKWNTAFTDFSEKIIKVSQRADQAQQRMVRSIEATATAYGKTGVDKLVAQRDKIIKQLGDEQKLVEKVTAAYAKMIEVEKNRKPGGEGHGTPAMLALRGLRDLFEGRTAYGEVQIGKSLAGLSGAPLVLGATAAALVGVSVASLEAAKSVAEYGQQVHDVELKTGLSARQVQQFDYAARASGSDVATLDRAMRGLTQATEGTDTKAQKARETLAGMGVDILALRSGVIPTVDVFKQVGSALEKQPNLWIRNKEAIELFNRSGITSLPMLLDLNRSLKESEGIKFASDEQIHQWEQMHHEIAKVATEFDQLMLQIKAAVAKPFILLFSLLPSSGFNIEYGPDGKPLGKYKAGAYEYPGWDAPLRNILSDRTHSDTASHPPLSIASRDAYLSGLRGTDSEYAGQEASRLKKIYDETQEDVTKTKDEIVKARKEYETQRDVAKSLQRIEAERLANAESLRKIQAESADKALHPYGLLPAERSLIDFSSRAGVSPSEISQARSALLPLLNEQRDEAYRRIGIRREGDHLVRVPLDDKGLPNGLVGFDSTSSIAAGHAAIEKNKLLNDALRGGIKPLSDSLAEARKLDEQTALGNLSLSSILSPSNISTRLEAEKRIAEIKKQNANQEWEDAKAKIADEYGDTTNQELALQALKLKNLRETAEIDDQLGEQVARERKQQLDSISSPATSLFHTLFTSPSKFGGQLGSTIHEAILRPVTEGLGTATSSILHPLIFGSDGTGGIAGAFRGAFGGGGKLSDVHLVNGAVPVIVVGGGGGGGGMGMGAGGGGGFPLPFNSNGSLYGLSGPEGSYGAGDFYGTGAGRGWLFGSGSPGGTSGFAGPVGDLGGGGSGSGSGGSGGGGWTGASGSPGSGIGGLFGGLGKGLSGTLANLKGLAGFGQVSTDSQGGQWATVGNQSISIDSLGGKLSAFSHSSLAKSGSFALGMALASNGLLGNNRGTAIGALEGAAGGAGIGFSIGGPIGAAIGGAVGLGIGLGEIIAGVESDRREVMRLVKEQYGIDINKSTADQIVALAKQSYGGKVSLAVRAPEVRQMLGLYAAGTGQSFPQSGLSPHGGSLVESGGKLFQNPIYQYGNPYTYQSSLPVYGGGGSGSFPSPGGGSSIALSISGRDAAKFFTGQVVTPEFVGSQYSAALASSSSRVNNALALSEPGAIVS